tara:strand:+ start:59 stop:976 length:918 start_codon:yes stop_codon:yes gene_type:complete
MHIKNSKERVKEILDFITKITLGSYSYTLPLRHKKDELEQIVLSLNTMVEEIDTVVHQINFDKSKEVVDNLLFNLDCNMHITSYSKNVQEILNYKKADLLSKPVKFILGEETRFPNDLSQLLEHEIEKNRSFKVDFKHRSGLLWTGSGYLHQLVSDGKKDYALSVFKVVYVNEKLNNPQDYKKRGYTTAPTTTRSLLLQDQRELARELHKFVMKRLDRNLVKLPEISRIVGASTSKIRTIFNRAYGDSIYNYHLRKRMEKAYTLIIDTQLPISEIKEECGFKSFSHFTRTFKKIYGQTPSEIRKS